MCVSQNKLDEVLLCITFTKNIKLEFDLFIYHRFFQKA